MKLIRKVIILLIGIIIILGNKPAYASNEFQIYVNNENKVVLDKYLLSKERILEQQVD